MESSASPLPIVVQLGFSGSRQLYDPAHHPEVDAGDFHAAVHDYLRQRLASLPATLGLSPRHFLCSISQAAIGADTLFTRACADLGLPQRIFLPQHRDEYLAAAGRSGPDFSADQRTAARELLELGHIIQLRVVSGAADREDRFRDAQLEIARVSDLVLCLVRADGSGRPGGTRELIELADKRGCPLLIIAVSVANGGPSFEENWLNRGNFIPPQLPEDVDHAELPATADRPLPGVTDYCRALKALGSRQADWQRQLFRTVAATILGSHLLATFCAVLAMKLHHPVALPVLLGSELVLLAIGFGVHQYLHRSHACGVWAVSRTVAEIGRSVSAMGAAHVYLEHLFHLPFPAGFRPLLRTLSVLHLRSTRDLPAATWQERRDAYLDQRLVDGSKGGQISYHTRALARSRRSLGIAHGVFLTMSLAAFVATSVKLAIAGHHHESAEAVLGSLAILLPVLAVAALSLAAAFDLEARVHTSGEILAFLKRQRHLLHHAASERECERLLLETESRLLGENANWFSRRSFTGIA